MTQEAYNEGKPHESFIPLAGDTPDRTGFECLFGHVVHHTSRTSDAQFIAPKTAPNDLLDERADTDKLLGIPRFSTVDPVDFKCLLRPSPATQLPVSKFDEHVATTPFALHTPKPRTTQGIESHAAPPRATWVL